MRRERRAEMCDKGVPGLSADVRPWLTHRFLLLVMVQVAHCWLYSSHSSLEGSQLSCVLGIPDSSVNCGFPWKTQSAVIELPLSRH